MIDHLMTGRAPKAPLWKTLFLVLGLSSLVGPQAHWALGDNSMGACGVTTASSYADTSLVPLGSQQTAYQGACYATPTDCSRAPNPKSLPPSYGGSGCFVQTNDTPQQGQSASLDVASRIQNNNSNPKKGKCDISEAINPEYSCDDTENLATAAQVTNVVGQSVGSMTTTAVGIQNTASATTTGTQAATYEAAANTAKISAYSEAALATSNLAMAALQFSNEMGHSSIGDQLKASAKQITNSSANGVASNMTSAQATDQLMTSGDSNVKNILENGVTASGNSLGIAHYSVDDTKGSRVTQEAGNVANGAASEQKNIANQGRLAAYQTLINGSANAIKAGIDYMQAEEYEKAAKELEATSASTGNTFVPDQGATNPSTSDYTAGSTAVNPGTAATASTGSQAPTTPAGNTNLGNPFNVGGGDSGNGNAPTPSAFIAGNGQSPAGGGGSGLSGGAGTPPAKAEDDATQPRSADNGRQNFGYGGGGGAAYVPGGVGAEKGENLSGLLNQLLPQKEEKETKRDGIMDFANRSPASEPYSLLGRNVNLFKRIEESMQANWRKGTVGI